MEPEWLDQKGYHIWSIRRSLKEGGCCLRFNLPQIEEKPKRNS